MKYTSVIKSQKKVKNVIKMLLYFSCTHTHPYTQCVRRQSCFSVSRGHKFSFIKFSCYGGGRNPHVNILSTPLPMYVRQVLYMYTNIQDYSPSMLTPILFFNNKFIQILIKEFWNELMENVFRYLLFNPRPYLERRKRAWARGAILRGVQISMLLLIFFM